MAMILDDYSLPYYPTQFTQPREKRSNAHLETYTSVGHFSWGMFIIGQLIEVQWAYMPSDQFDALDAIFQADAEVIWDPGIPGSSSTYNVQILDFDGDYFEAVGTDSEIWRQNCRMVLLIMAASVGS